MSLFILSISSREMLQEIPPRGAPSHNTLPPIARNSRPLDKGTDHRTQPSGLVDYNATETSRDGKSHEYFNLKPC